MDVLLDSNIYLQDLKMTGNQFAELFVYLRRTGSRLLIPHLVREEVKAKYSERLTETRQKAQSAHENLWKLASSDAPRFVGPQPDQEVKSLLKRFQLPAKGVQILEVDSYSSIDLREVVRRGIHRERPASAAGEELRDVVLWLLALHLAKNSGSGIVFISMDKTFASENGRDLHPDLINDVGSLNVTLDFYPGIREFVVAKALNYESINAAQLFSIVPVQKVQDLTASLMPGRSTRVGNILTAEITELEFERAVRYQVGENAYFIEAGFGGSARLSIEEFTTIVNYNYNPVAFEPAKQAYDFESAPAVQIQARPYKGFQFLESIVAPAFSENLMWNNPVTVFAAPKPRKYVCSFRVNVSARVLNGSLESLEADAISFTSFLLDEPGVEQNPT